MFSLAGFLADVDWLGAVVSTRFHQYPSGSLLTSLQPTAQVQQPTHRLVSMTMTWWGVVLVPAAMAVTPPIFQLVPGSRSTRHWTGKWVRGPEPVWRSGGSGCWGGPRCSA